MLSRQDFDDPCPGCGALIDRDKPHASRRVYCTAQCGQRDYHRMEAEAVLEAKRNRPPCRRCGRAIPAAKLSTKLYCSKQCRNDHHNDAKKAASRKARAIRPPCRSCGGQVPVELYPQAVFCCDDCRSVGGIPKTCEFCGKGFMGVKRSKYCGLSCAARHRQAVRRRTA